MDKAFEVVDTSADLDRLTLHVTASNSRAVGIYHRAGFKVIREFSSLLTGLFLHEDKWLYMVRIPGELASTADQE